jgi:hypothetical protein
MGMALVTLKSSAVLCGVADAPGRVARRQGWRLAAGVKQPGSAARPRHIAVGPAKAPAGNDVGTAG